MVELVNVVNLLNNLPQAKKSYLRCLNWTVCQTSVAVCHLRICQLTIGGREGGGSSSGDECGIRYCYCSKCSVLLKTMLLLDAGEDHCTNYPNFNLGL